MASLTDKRVTAELRDAKASGADVWLTDATTARGVGRLRLRARSSGQGMFYFRYSDAQGKQDQLHLGMYDNSGVAGLSLKDARAKAGELSRLYQAGHRDLRAYIEHQQAEERSRIGAAARVRSEASQFTLERLLDEYCDYLQALGRRSHKDARSIFKLHIKGAWPKVAAMPAKEVTGEHFADMMRTLNEAGKGRTANKLRSYARSAYQVAKAAKSKPSIPVAFKGFNVVLNPVADTEPDEAQNRPDKHPLKADELRTYWNAIRDLPGFKGAILRLHLLTGGQRIEQLVNLRTDNIADDAILLHDGKGRPGRPPRPHTVPLTKAATQALAECEPKGEFALSTSGGKTHLAATTLSRWSVEAIGDAIDGFQAKRLRSGVETLLASAGVSREHRGRLQSHGVGGVQARSYDAYEYLIEKRKALETLYKLLQRDASGKANVVAMKRKA